MMEWSMLTPNEANAKAALYWQIFVLKSKLCGLVPSKRSVTIFMFFLLSLFLNDIFAVTFFHCDMFCFTYVFSCCWTFYFWFGHESLSAFKQVISWVTGVTHWMLWLTRQVIGSRYESLVVIWIVFTWYKRVVSQLYSLVKLYTTKLLLHSLVPKVT